MDGYREALAAEEARRITFFERERPRAHTFSRRGLRMVPRGFRTVLVIVLLSAGSADEDYAYAYADDLLPSPNVSMSPNSSYGNDDMWGSVDDGSSGTTIANIRVGLAHELCFESCALNDQVGGMDATLVNGAACTVGEGVTVNGVDSYVDLDAVEIGGALSISMWYRPSTMGRILEFGDDEFFNNVFINLNPDNNNIKVVVRNELAVAVTATASQFARAPDGEFRHVLVIVDADGLSIHDDDQFSVYSDAADDDGAEPVVMTRAHHYLGRPIADSYHWFNGTIRSLQIWSRALDDYEIDEVYETPACATDTPTLSPTSIPAPTALPIPAPTPTPIPAPTPLPIPAPTVYPGDPTANPTSTSPSIAPTHAPTAAPLPEPSGSPTTMPVSLPSPGPSALPEPSPTVYPGDPTANPTSTSPWSMPTHVPTAAPSSKPSGSPTPRPTITPTVRAPAPTAACYVQVADGAAGEAGCSDGFLPGFPGTTNATACYYSCEGAYGNQFLFFVYTASASTCSCRSACSLTKDSADYANPAYLVYQRTCFDPTAAPTSTPTGLSVPSMAPTVSSMPTSQEPTSVGKGATEVPTLVPNASALSQPSPTPTVLSGGWYDSGAGLSCTDGCAAYGLACSAEQLFAHNEDVDSSAEVLALIAELGGVTSATECGDLYGSSLNVPNFNSNVCWISDTNRALSAFDCSSAHGNGVNHRLCYCFATEQTHKPTHSPALAPTTLAPTTWSTAFPSAKPSARPSAAPSLVPQPLPTSPPSFGPTFVPIPQPTSQPTPVSCVDSVRNGDESDIDCGGQCPPCIIGAVCALDSDCVTETCDLSVCVAPDPTASPTPLPTLSPTFTPCDWLAVPVMPQLNSPRFSSTGGQFFVSWDEWTDRAGHGGDTFPCDTVLEFPGVGTADCTFTSRTNLTVMLGCCCPRARALSGP